MTYADTLTCRSQRTVFISSAPIIRLPFLAVGVTAARGTSTNIFVFLTPYEIADLAIASTVFVSFTLRYLTRTSFIAAVTGTFTLPVY